MIASVTGAVARAGLDHVVVEVGGVGMLVHVTPATASTARHGASLTLQTSLVVREDSLTLFGFTSQDERALFELVQTVSGVGPRLALAILAVLEPEVLRTAVAGGDLGTLTKVPGIGKKSAERLVLELRDRIGAATTTAGITSPAPGTTTPGGGWRAPVIEALVGLGWTAKQAEAGLDAVTDSLGPDPDVSAALRAALQELGR